MQIVEVEVEAGVTPASNIRVGSMLRACVPTAALHALTVGGRHEADLVLWIAKCQPSHAHVGFRRKLDVYKEGLKTSLPFAARSLEAKYSMFGFSIGVTSALRVSSCERENLDEFA